MRKAIKNFEDFYEITDKGEIITLKRDKYIKKEKITKGYKNKKGYLVFDFRRKGGKVMLVHRLVAEAFLPNPKKLPQVNHKDENKENNFVSNLEWCDNSYNHDYGTRIERCAAKLKKKVVQYSLCGAFIAEYDGVRDAARLNGFKANSCISECCVGKRKTAYGYIWRFKEAE